MTRPIKAEHNIETGETIYSEMNDEEFAQYEIDVANTLAQTAAREAELTAKEETKAAALAKLTALGLTEEEAKAIAG